MADFSYLSDSDDSAVEELISQTKDLCALEQISAINCSGFSDSVLPSDLESRFRRLKSFPATKSNVQSSGDRNSASVPKPENKSSSKGEAEVDGKNECSSPSMDGKTGSKQSRSRSISFPLESPDDEEMENAKLSPLKEDLHDQKDLKAKRKSGKIKDNEQRRDLDARTPSYSSNSSTEDELFSPCKQKSDRKRHLYSRSKSTLEPVSSPLTSSSTRMSSPSPPRKTGCFWCSPKKGNSPRKSTENRMKVRSCDWSQHDDFAEDLVNFSMKEQQKILKKAMKEGERVSRETEKILRMVKQASARMTVIGIEDELTDDES